MENRSLAKEATLSPGSQSMDERAHSHHTLRTTKQIPGGMLDRPHSTNMDQTHLGKGTGKSIHHRHPLSDRLQNELH